LPATTPPSRHCAELARAKWGNEVTIHGSADFKERALSLAVERGITVNNPEVQAR